MTVQISAKSNDLSQIAKIAQNHGISARYAFQGRLLILDFSGGIEEAVSFCETHNIDILRIVA